MADFLAIMLYPFVACLILTGVHAYLGVHVIRRGVIFVDLALAQLAALGATFAFLFGFRLHSTASYLSSFAVALVGALIFAATRQRRSPVPQEAIIGIVYAVASAASLLVLSQAPEGGEELKALLIGHLLFVDRAELLHIAGLYLPVAFLHWRYAEPLWEISSAPDAALGKGRNLRLWDLFFYGTFALVVTSSVEVAGVLLVFSFLVAPAVCAALLAETLRGQTAVAWCVSFVTSMAGIASSYVLDLPTGACIVCAFGVSCAGCALVSKLRAV